ncbi:hypothetical protein IIA15_08115 [candidate division TA06 bacterium]|nr:hypothetical protein [candidate division TA06 bacterium]
MIYITLLLLSALHFQVAESPLITQGKMKEEKAYMKLVLSEEERQKRQSLKNVREYSITLIKYNHTISKSFIDPDSLFPLWLETNAKLIETLEALGVTPYSIYNKPMKPAGIQYESGIILSREHFYLCGIYEWMSQEGEDGKIVPDFSVLRDFSAKYGYQEWYLYLSLKQARQYSKEYSVEGALNLKNIASSLILTEDYINQFPDGAHLSKVQEFQDELLKLFQYPFDRGGWDNWNVRESHVIQQYLQAYNYYLSRRPDSKFAGSVREMKNRLKEMLEE